MSAQPEFVRINAFTGEPDPGSGLAETSGGWLGTDIVVPARFMGPRPIPSLSAWEDPEVGWGLVLPMNEELSNVELATAMDAPEAIQHLVSERGNAPVLRWSKNSPLLTLRRYYADGTSNEPALTQARGTARNRIPKYLLLYGAPSVLPWSLQYRLNAHAFVGRLDLEGQALNNYVMALIANWTGSAWDTGKARQDRAVVWAVEHSDQDITNLMRRVIAKPVNKVLKGYAEFTTGLTYVNGKTERATHDRLVEALNSTQPGLIVTTSHGMTGPLNNVPKMAAQLGLLVDAGHQTLDPADLLQHWDPNGAIWYAHACCSAGGDDSTSYKGLTPVGSHVTRVLEGVAAVGAMTAPMPRALLGSERPLRAFVGQVEPTFDWTLKHQYTRQMLTDRLVKALTNHIYQPPPQGPYPIGRALGECHQQAPLLNSLHLEALRKFNDQGEDTFGEILAYRLMAVDWQSMVILGDPTVALPAL